MSEHKDRFMVSLSTITKERWDEIFAPKQMDTKTFAEVWRKYAYGEVKEWRGTTNTES